MLHIMINVQRHLQLGSLHILKKKLRKEVIYICSFWRKEVHVQYLSKEFDVLLNSSYKSWSIKPGTAFEFESAFPEDCKAILEC